MTELEVDAIVNPSNRELKMDAGLAGWIKQKAGAAVEDEAKKKGPLEPGSVIWTGAGRLKSKYIIHAVTVGGDGRADEMTIRRACAGAFGCAGELNVKSVALPALGCGAGGFPVVGSAKIMAQETLKFARFGNSTVREVVYCLKDDETYQTFEKQIYGYINHVQNDLGLGPYVTVDIIIEWNEGIVLIERSNPPFGLALPGGFLDYGESLEQGAIREAKEETNMDLLDLCQFHTYSSPDRDPRFQTVSTVFVAKGRGTPRFGDDAKGLRVVAVEDLLKLDYAFDHKQVIQDYLALVKRF